MMVFTNRYPVASLTLYHAITKDSKLSVILGKLVIPSCHIYVTALPENPMSEKLPGIQADWSSGRPQYSGGQRETAMQTHGGGRERGREGKIFLGYITLNLG